ncbi:S-adenosyl-L-methionine-dependent methyltransferase [Mortierella sp. GBAus27b]|nr:S-adenosyl-L-methionine-dependent methyltransferase [Mortierella sp. GBAus27b]
MSNLPRLSAWLARSTIKRDLQGLGTIHSSQFRHAQRSRNHYHHASRLTSLTSTSGVTPHCHHHHQQQHVESLQFPRKRAFHATAAHKSFVDDPQNSPEKIAARSKYPIVTAKDTAKSKSMPHEVKMLVREFIDDSLYHPHYGYFSKQAVIFSPETDFEFDKIKDNMEFLDRIADKYKEVEDDMDVRDEVARQVWHTPTELFKPWYGYAIAKYIVTEYKLNNYPHKDLIIYEMGAGNGTLMLNILDYIQQFEPSVYERTHYRIIEISKKLAQRQGERQEVRDVTRRHSCVEVIHKSIFEWDTLVPDDCFFVGMEVLDNFSHDLIRYDSVTEEPLQGMVAIDEEGPEFIPTRLLVLLEILKSHFPHHRLVLSDFFTLPEAIPGTDAPVVQTRYQGTMVPCSTYMVMPGMFDIFFPTNFELLRDMYQQVCRPALGMEKSVKVQTQKQFLERYGDLEKTRTYSGENPMLMYYENNKMFLS